MAQGTLSPTPWFTGFLNTGFINAGGLLFTYAAGTTTKQNTYSDVALTVPNTNPIVLDSAGRATIFLTPGQSYKFVMSPPGDTDPPSNPIRTQDNISASPITAGGIDVLATAGVNITIGQAVYLSDGSGGLNAGQWYLADSTNNYSSSTAPYIGIASSTFTVGNVGVVRVDGQYSGLAGLTAGVTYYISTAGTLTSSAPGNARKILVADSTISGLLMQDPQVVIVAATNTQTFVANGTWTMPANPLWVKVVCYGGGGGGGGGSIQGGAGVAASGGTGGAGGARTEALFQPSDLSSPVTVTVGAGGPGATGAGAAAAGGSTTFGPYLLAYGGGGGQYSGATSLSGGSGGGAASAGQVANLASIVGGLPGGGTGTGNPSSSDGGGGAANSAVGGPSIRGGGGGGGEIGDGSVGKAGATSMYGGGGGGGGGGVTAANANTAGGAGGAVSQVAALGTGGGGTAGLAATVFNTNQNGAAGSAVAGGAGGGGGGGRHDATAAAAGGAGGTPAGGGGGGGSSQSGAGGAAGSGGAGGSGAVYVITGLGVSQ